MTDHTDAPQTRDIVERLHGHTVQMFPSRKTYDLLSEAAAVIESLRRNYAEMLTEMKTGVRLRSEGEKSGEAPASSRSGPPSSPTSDQAEAPDLDALERELREVDKASLRVVRGEKVETADVLRVAALADEVGPLIAYVRRLEQERDAIRGTTPETAWRDLNALSARAERAEQERDAAVALRDAAISGNYEAGREASELRAAFQKASDDADQYHADLEEARAALRRVYESGQPALTEAEHQGIRTFLSKEKA